MANAFKLKTFDGSSTNANTDMTIYTCPSSTETTIIGMSIANITSSQITVDVKLESDTSDTETNSKCLPCERCASAGWRCALCRLVAIRRSSCKRPMSSRCRATQRILPIQP